MTTSRSPSNQSPPMVGYNGFADDGVLSSLAQQFPASVRENLTTHGHWTGSEDALDLARLANMNIPQLRTRDASGERLDRVDYHPAYHALMRRSMFQGLHNSIWQRGNEEKGLRYRARAMRFMMTAGLEMGHLCPITMTNAAVAALMTDEAVAREWVPKLLTSDYDATARPPGDKSTLTIGMGMTERQGGTDVRSNTSRADKSGNGRWTVNGEKWFFSAPMCDAFLVLAQTEAGLGCFLLPRILPDGTPNSLRFQHLKDKLGNRSNASSEVLFDNAQGLLLGEEGRGVATILEMVTLTRLDCAVGSAGIMRKGLDEAVHHTRHRSVSSRLLIDQPLMVRVLADMALDVAAAQALSIRLAQSYDRAPNEEGEAAYARLMTPVAKYWVCKLAPPLINECMESIGGNGYVEESIMPRLYREAPLNAIWEGSGNVMCLDVLRALRRNPQALDAVLADLGQALGSKGSQTIDVLRIAADMALQDEGSARLFTEQLALTAAAAALKAHLPAQLGDAFMETRLGRMWRHTYGMLDARYDGRAIIDFVCPTA